jgi:hypothetical protein
MRVAHGEVSVESFERGHKQGRCNTFPAERSPAEKKASAVLGAFRNMISELKYDTYRPVSIERINVNDEYSRARLQKDGRPLPVRNCGFNRRSHMP